MTNKCECGHDEKKHTQKYGCNYRYPNGSQHDYQDSRGYCVCIEFFQIKESKLIQVWNESILTDRTKVNSKKEKEYLLSTISNIERDFKAKIIIKTNWPHYEMYEVLKDDKGITKPCYFHSANSIKQAHGYLCFLFGFLQTREITKRSLLELREESLKNA